VDPVFEVTLVSHSTESSPFRPLKITHPGGGKEPSNPSGN
jgi:hypothetical protein